MRLCPCLCPNHGLYSLRHADYFALVAAAIDQRGLQNQDGWLVSLVHSSYRCVSTMSPMIEYPCYDSVLGTTSTFGSEMLLAPGPATEAPN
jgi:hypothetical protein